MTPDLFLQVAIAPAWALVPTRMRSREAAAMIVAIALQESALVHRRQMKGSARSYLQFERAGVMGVLRHAASMDHARMVCASLDIVPTVNAVYQALTFGDALAVCFGRLLLWTDPEPLPERDQPAEISWQIYLRTWRPGRPRRETWDACVARAWQALTPINAAIHADE